ncbi:MAG: DUF6683 family protein [Gammaproteobacteria bacterium]
MNSRSLFALVLGAFVLPAANAQDYMGMFNASNTAGINIAGTIAVNSAMGKGSGKPSRKTQRERADALSDAQLDALTFKPDPGVSRRVKEEFKRAVQQADPGRSAHIASVLDRQDVLADFDRDMQPYGLRSNNIADAMSAYWLTMWIVANNRAVPSAARVAAARRQVTHNMLSNSMVAKASLTERQEITEALVYETMFALGQRATAERNKDRARERELAATTQRNLLKSGVDLQRLRLTTKDGFISY